MKPIILIIAAMFVSEYTLAQEIKNPAAEGFFVPAEFSQQTSVWLAWPQYEPVKGRSNIPQIVEIISAISLYEDIELIVNDHFEEMKAREYLKKAQVSVQRVHFHTIRHTDFWMRDVGAVFIRNKNGERAVVDLHFNGWGMGAVSNFFKTISQIDGKIDQAMAKEVGIPIVSSSLVAEGGAFEFNGKGTVIASESVILQPQRNPGMTKKRAEAELKRIFGVKKIIWLKQGIVADDSTFYGPLPYSKEPLFTALTTNGHTDEFVRWINDDTVLLAEVTQQEANAAGPHSISLETRKRLEKNYDILIHSTNQDGKPIKVIRMPVAEEITQILKPGDSTFDGVIDMVRIDPGHENEPVLDKAHKKSAKFVSATSYLNFLITNKAVLIPQYWIPGRSEITREKDKKAKAILQTAFPGRLILAINRVEDINSGGGGIHCISQQMP